MNVTTKLRIDLQKKTFQPEIDAVQGDVCSRQLELSLYTGSTPWIIPDHTLVAVRYCKEDRTHGYYDTMPDGTSAWSFHDNIVTVRLAPQMLTVPGNVVTQVELLLENAVLATFGLRIRVEANAAAGALRSETYINWLEWIEQQLSAHIENGQFTGPQGPAGPAARIISYSTAYQAGESGTTVPTGSWTTQIPYVPQGQYLWARTTQVYSSGDTVELYTVTRFGLDGSGSVSSVADISPDKNGNVSLTAADVGALPLAGGTMEGPVNMNGQRLSGLNVPTEDTEPATKGYALGLLKTAAPRNLLDNSDFTNLVAQAGYMGAHGTSVYLADRWIVNSSLISYDSATRVVSFEESSLPLIIRQAIAANISGKPVSFAIKASSVSGAVYLSESGTESGHADAAISEGITVHNFVGGENVSAIIWSKENASLCIDWIALYEGTYTTETLPAYVPRGYGAELAECMRYYQTVSNGFGAANSAGSILYAMFPLTVPMAGTPSIAYKEALQIIGNGTAVTTTASSASVKYMKNASTVEADVVGTFTDFANHAVTILGAVAFSSDL